MVSPRIESLAERLNFNLQMAQFAPANHLIEREKSYCTMGVIEPEGCFIVRETNEGWWCETIDLKNAKQLQKLIDDPTVACGWVNSLRFPGNGGWDDPNG